MENKRGGYDRSLFERLLTVGYTVLFLDVQYRQPPINSLWTSAEFYHNKLVDAPSLVDQPVYSKLVGNNGSIGSLSLIIQFDLSSHCASFRFGTLVFYDTQGRGFYESAPADEDDALSKQNVGEANCIMNLLGRFFELHPRMNSPYTTIAVATGYKAQVIAWTTAGPPAVGVN
jgi:superfamily I DNA and/or RNA helicase